MWCSRFRENTSLNNKMVQNSKHKVSITQLTHTKSTTCLLVKKHTKLKYCFDKCILHITLVPRPSKMMRCKMCDQTTTLHDHFDEMTASIWIATIKKTKKNKQTKNNDRNQSQHTQPEFSWRSYPHKRSSILKTEIAMFFISDTIQNRSRNSQANEGNQKK